MSSAACLRWSQSDLDPGVLHVVRVKGSNDRAHGLDRDELRDLRKLWQAVEGLYVFETGRGFLPQQQLAHRAVVAKWYNLKRLSKTESRAILLRSARMLARLAGAKCGEDRSMRARQASFDRQRMEPEMSEQHPLREIELKMVFPDDARDAIERQPALAAVAHETVEQRAVYYDTPDLKLRDAGFSLRVRRNGDELVQTLKQDEGAGGITTDRGEWEWNIGSELPEPHLLRGTPAAPFADAGLQAMWELDVTRTIRRLWLPGDTSVEVATDEGWVAAGEARERIRELELELKSGPALPLYRLALELHATVPLRLSAESKAARGYRLRMGRPPAAVEAPTPDIDADATGYEAFRAIVSGGVSGLIRNQAAAELAIAEGTHQMRVSVRKLRAACVLYRPLLEPHAARQFDIVLGRLGRILGEARDWDVFCGETLPKARDGVEQASWVNLLADAAQRRRDKAYKAVRDELAQPAITGVALGLTAWSEDDAALGDEKLGRPLKRLAPGLLDRLADKTAKRGRGLENLPPEDIHRLRKAMKKLRYGAEYFSGAYPEKIVKRYLKPVKRLQKLLGKMNDSSMAATLAERLCEDEALDRVPALGDIAAWAEARRRVALLKLPKAWRSFRKADPFWV